MNAKLPTLSLLVSLVAATATVRTAGAQDQPQPAPELQKYASLIGHWQGSGTAQMGPGEPTKWQSRTTYAWALDKFYVQEDTVVTFADMPKPLVMRSYLGWDPENQRHVAVGIDNDGSVGVQRVEFGPDGTMALIVEKTQEGQTYVERYSSKVSGDTMTFGIDMLAPTGPAMQVVKGTMQRVDKAAPVALDASSFTAKPAAAVAQLAKTAGTFAVKATMTMMPGMPVMNITGTDEVKSLFDGTIVHVHTTGTAEGHDGTYVGEVFYGVDAKTGQLAAVFVSNMGEVGLMNGTFTADNRQLILTSAARMMGQPCVQRMIMQLDDNGAPKSAIGHCILGTAAPYESWNATYTKTK